MSQNKKWGAEERASLLTLPHDLTHDFTSQPSLQDLTFEAVLRDQLRRLHDRTGKGHRVIAPGKAMGSGLRYVGSVTDILPARAKLVEDMAQRYASHIVVQLPYVPSDMLSMFEHAGKHLLRMARAALDLECSSNPSTSVRDCLINTQGLDEVLGVFMTVRNSHDDDDGAWLSLYQNQNNSSWHDSNSLSPEFETYMDELGLIARFTLAVRLWHRVRRINAHDIVELVQSRIISPTMINLGTEPRNHINYSLEENTIVVHLPVHDHTIEEDDADRDSVTVEGLATSLARAYPEDTLVPCAVAAGLSQEEATKFVRNLARPFARARKS